MYCPFGFVGTLKVIDMGNLCRFINTIKYVKMAASSNFGNVFSVLGEFLQNIS
jgi:hypothetical protein